MHVRNSVFCQIVVACLTLICFLGFAPEPILLAWTAAKEIIGYFGKKSIIIMHSEARGCVLYRVENPCAYRFCGKVRDILLHTPNGLCLYIGHCVRT